MSDKGLFATICSFFSGLFSSDNAASSAPSTTSSNKASDGLTGVERYIKEQAGKVSKITGVEAYIRNQSGTQTVTSVEAYIRNQANAQKITGVEAYIRSQG